MFARVGGISHPRHTCEGREPVNRSKQIFVDVILLCDKNVVLFCWFPFRERFFLGGAAIPWVAAFGRSALRPYPALQAATAPRSGAWIPACAGMTSGGCVVGASPCGRPGQARGPAPTSLPSCSARRKYDVTSCTPTCCHCATLPSRHACEGRNKEQHVNRTAT